MFYSGTDISFETKNVKAIFLDCCCCCCLHIKVGLGISRTNADSQWNPVYNVFHRNFLLWKRNDSSVVLYTWSWRGKPRSSRAAESKRRAIGNHSFSERICYMFLISKCRGDWDLGLCTTSVLAFWEPHHDGKIRGKNVFWRIKNGFCHYATVLQTQVPKLCTALDLILGTCRKFARKNNFLSLGVCFPQPCSSAGRRFAASRSRLQNYRRIVWFPQQKIRWNTLYWESTLVREILNPTLIQLNHRAQNVSGPWREPHRQYQSELRSTTCSTSWRKIQPIAFGVSFLHSQISIDDLVLQVSFCTFRWKEIKEIEKGLLDVFVFSSNQTRFLSVSS